MSKPDINWTTKCHLTEAEQDRLDDAYGDLYQQVVNELHGAFQALANGECEVTEWPYDAVETYMKDAAEAMHETFRKIYNEHRNPDYEGKLGRWGEY